MQIQYNITRIEEWCKSHDMPEGTLQLEHLMQATKLLQLKKVGFRGSPFISMSSFGAYNHSQASAADIDIIYDVCWMLSPMQIQRLCTNYYVADYEVSRKLHEEFMETQALHRIRFLQTSCELWQLEWRPEIVTTTFCLRLRVRRLDRTSSHCQEMFPV